MHEVKLKLRAGLTGLLYRKALRLSKSAISDGVAGQLINLMTNDIEKFDFVFWIHELWKGPLGTIILGYFVYLEVGVAAIVGLVFLLSMMPLQGVF